MNNTNQTKKPFDYKQFEADLETFQTQLHEHLWSFEANNYADYLTALKKEAFFAQRAEKLGIQGVEIYRHISGYKMEKAKRPKIAEEYERQIAHLQSLLDSHRKTIKEMREKFFRPVDYYQESLESFDWYYAESDDIRVFRQGVESEKALIQRAKDEGVEFQDALVAYWRRRSGRDTVSWDELEKKLR